MAKVGRAAFAASRARLEIVSADKTINKNESGEVYGIDAGGNVDITLPTDPESGTRYKFMIIDDVTGGTVKITASSTNPFQGGLLHIDTDTPDEDDGSGEATQIIAVPVNADGDAGNDDILTMAADTKQGSYVVCIYDSANSSWLVEGLVMANTAPTFA